MKKKTESIVLRSKRQITLPKALCDQLGIETGDYLDIHVQDSILIAKPRKTVALEALREIQAAFQSSGINEEELQKAGREVREELIRKKYGIRS
jgi:AbrB family looped-hinge helix DNA binding protein